MNNAPSSSNVLRAERWLRAQEFGGPALIVIVLVLLSASVGSATTQLVTARALVNLVLVVGFYLFAGNSGIVSFGHMAFMGVGAYAAAIVSVPVGLKTTLLADLPGPVRDTQLSLYPAVAIGAVVAALLALVTGPIIMRLSGLSAGIATLALLLAVRVIIVQTDSWTRGNQTMIGIPQSMTLGDALVIALIAMLICYLHQRSKSGLLLRAVRDDELAALSLGVKNLSHRSVAFVLSAAICGAGGAMLAFYQGSLSPTQEFFLDPTFLVIVMLVAGGLRSFAGAVLGTILVSVLAEVLRLLTNGVAVGGYLLTLPAGIQSVVLGVLTLLILIFRPGGIMGLREFRLPLPSGRRQRSAPASAGPADASAEPPAPVTTSPGPNERPAHSDHDV